MKMPVKKKNLGRGLNALLADDATGAGAVSLLVPVQHIVAGKYQPRTHFDPVEIASLTESIKINGVLTPVLLRSIAPNSYELIAGERRWRAAQAAGLTEIPAHVRDVDDAQALEMAIVENEQRDDLTAIESARAYQRLMDEFAYTQQQVSERIGVSRVQVSNLLRLLQLSPNIQSLIEERKLGMGHARALVGLNDDVAIRVAQQSIREGWSTRHMEQQVKKGAKTVKAKVAQAEDSQAIVALSDELSKLLSTDVVLTQKKVAKGLHISFSSTADLEALVKKLRS